MTDLLLLYTMLYTPRVGAPVEMVVSSKTVLGVRHARHAQHTTRHDQTQTQPDKKTDINGVVCE